MPSKLITLILCLTLFNCATDPKDRTTDWPAEKLYSEAQDALQNGDYEQAIKYYELLEAYYPHEDNTQNAQLELIYAYHKFEETDSALTAAERFIQLYPKHSHVDYAYYLKGLIPFEATQSRLDKFFPLDRSQRDQSTALRAFRHFSELITRFPNSRYVEDAQQKMLVLRNSLARHELQVAQFYMVKGAYLAAANRAKTVIESYQQTPAVPEALTILAKSYKVMGLDTLSDDALAVLKLNYPDYQGVHEVNTVVVK